MQNLERIRNAIAAAELEALLLIDSKNRYYATGFPSSDGVVLITPEQAYVIIDGRYIEACRAAIGDSAEVLLCNQENPARAILKQLLETHGITRLGAEDGCLTHQQFTMYEKLLGCPLQNAQGILNRLRSEKQPHELEYLRAAQDITDAAFAEVLKRIRPGVTEREIAAELVYQMLLRGAEGNSFDPIVVAGARGSMPHGVPSDAKVQAGDFVTMDFGCLKGGYCSDMTRTVAVGHVTDEMRTVYDTVLRAQLAGIAIARAGVSGAAIDGAARDVITEAGYGEYFTHSFGHSLGLDIHEAPNCTPTNQFPMPEHTVCSAEPGIYIPGRFGVRIEDVMHLTKDGAEVLTHSPKELIIV
ncbi:MAG: aminopeptidase P family protein [Oscillospiraceae bacterium]|nr:aminopeptidase P family protein [Oscillospiraceae bacterium]